MQFGKALPTAAFQSGCKGATNTENAASHLSHGKSNNQPTVLWRTKGSPARTLLSNRTFSYISPAELSFASSGANKSLAAIPDLIKSPQWMSCTIHIVDAEETARRGIRISRSPGEPTWPPTLITKIINGHTNPSAASLCLLYDHG